jgi:DNA-binding transcriptional LysR family regulator
MRFSGIDANLLIALNALLREKNVTRAAQRVGRGQPAMSHALARLRAYFEDPLLVPEGRGLALSPRGQELSEPVARAMSALLEVFDKHAGAEKRANRRFVIASSDLFACRFFPELLRTLQRDDPTIVLEARPLSARSTEQILGDGIDLAFGVYEDVPLHVNQQLLFNEPFVCVVRTDHPKVRKAIPLRLYLDLPHLEIIFAPRARIGERVDRMLAATGTRRRVTASVAHFSVARRVLEANDHVLTMTKGNAESLIQGSALRIVDAPLELPPLGFSQIWLRHRDEDTSHRWLRETAARVCTSQHDEEAASAN